MTTDLVTTSPPPRRRKPHTGRRRGDPPGLERDRQKSRVGNGSDVVADVDQRSRFPRRLRELLADHLSDRPDASVAERCIIKRACVIEVELERMETGFALNGEASPAALDLYARVSGNLRRLLESVGLERRAKQITGPTLGAILRNGIEQPDSEPIASGPTS
jgi:hypothetical protein